MSAAGGVPSMAASSAAVNSGPSTAAARIASWAAGLSRSTRDLHEALEHLRQLRSRRLAQRPGPALADQGPGLQERAQALLEEQRIALGAVEHRGENLGGPLAPPTAPGPG